MKVRFFPGQIIKIDNQEKRHETIMDDCDGDLDGAAKLLFDESGREG